MIMWDIAFNVWFVGACLCYLLSPNVKTPFLWLFVLFWPISVPIMIFIHGYRGSLSNVITKNLALVTASRTQGIAMFILAVTVFLHVINH